TVCVVGKIRDLILQLSKSSIYSTKPIQDGLFELRVGRKDISRTFFAYAKGRKIYILRTFIKKTPKTPKAEIALATSRWEELKDGC
ncbi:type II toxin-antitoxin system RelE/ParE family toxin, partial [Escherichia coli]